VLYIALQKVRTAFWNAGWLMVGTGAVAWLLQVDGLAGQWARGSVAVGSVFVLLAYVAKRRTHSDAAEEGTSR
jgi:hypothetical protein